MKQYEFAFTTITAILRASPLPLLEARILLSYVLGWSHTELITRSEQLLNTEAAVRFHKLELRRTAGEPVAQLTGMREFYGLKFEVTPHVLIPRPETELLVEMALSAIADVRCPRILDLGTGTGAIAIAIALMRPDAQVWAVDCSVEALAVTARNVVELVHPERVGGTIVIQQSDWYSTLDVGLCFSAIVSNPPYIAKDDPHLLQGDLRFEPRIALTDEFDGFTAIRNIISGAPLRLVQNGALWIEHGYNQAETVRAVLVSNGFANVRSKHDLANIARISGGVLAS